MSIDRTVAPEIKRLSSLIERYMVIEKEKNGLPDLTGRHMHILGYINREKEAGRDVYQRDIETKLGVRPSTSTAMLQILEKNGYIRRERVANDARLKKLVLTDKAENAIDATLTAIGNTEANVRKGITPEELEVFFNVIDKMESNLCINLGTK
ncbi:MAG: MarR family transcriptional regulator [Clostridiales bacterium]|nr:MarR family transcriptional regulator [Clostridiales bacterium]